MGYLFAMFTDPGPVLTHQTGDNIEKENPTETTASCEELTVLYNVDIHIKISELPPLISTIHCHQLSM